MDRWKKSLWFRSQAMDHDSYLTVSYGLVTACLVLSTIVITTRELFALMAVYLFVHILWFRFFCSFPLSTREGLQSLFMALPGGSFVVLYEWLSLGTKLMTCN